MPLAHQQSRPQSRKLSTIDLEFQTVDNVHRAAFAQRQVMRRIKRLRRKIAERAGQLAVVSAAERVAIVLDQPQLVLFAKVHDGGQIETDCPACARK